MTRPPGLTCPRCSQTFDGRRAARRTREGYVHARPCTSPRALAGGTWVQGRYGIHRWSGGASTRSTRVSR